KSREEDRAARTSRTGRRRTAQAGGSAAHRGAVRRTATVAETAHAGTRRAADAAPSHRRTTSDDTDAAAADRADAARRPAEGADDSGTAHGQTNDHAGRRDEGAGSRD